MERLLKTEYHITVLSKKFRIDDMPSWMYKLDHGTNFNTGYADMYTSSKIILKKITKFFKRKKIKLHISEEMSDWED